MAMEQIDLKKKILDQVEVRKFLSNIEYVFYFGDKNFLSDRFIRKFSSEQGWMPIEILLRFNLSRTRMYTFDIRDRENQLKTIRNALDNSNIVELNEDGTKVRRRLIIN